MGDENHIRTLGDYSKPSHEVYKNTIELLVGNNVVPLRSYTIRLVQNGCPIYELQSEDPNQHLNDFLKLVDSLNLDGENKERTRLPHTERMERFENTIFKQREEINDRMTEMFGLLKELTSSRAPKKVLIREEAKFPVTKNVNSISLTRGEEETIKEAKKEDEVENEQNRKTGKEKTTEEPSSQPIEYYPKHRINEKLIEGLMGNHRLNDSLSGARFGKIKGKTHNLSPRGLVYEAILRKKITRKEDIRGNFEIPCNIGGLKHMNALVDQGSDVNVMPLSTYMKLTNVRPTEMDIRLSLASHSYIYPLGIAEEILVEVAEHVYPMDFVILDIKEDEKRPFILGTSFLTTVKAVIKFDKGTITLRSGKSKISFHRIPESLYKIERRVKNDIDPIAPTVTVNRLVLE
ncbi:MAK10-like protein [Tanacetum coccineum]|uniref:MAK10-like protein n=1 Tax=Tanacetum coccineum TaxID=301880 RepID=A0ABQ5HED8_9ASTR